MVARGKTGDQAIGHATRRVERRDLLFDRETPDAHHANRPKTVGGGIAFLTQHHFLRARPALPSEVIGKQLPGSLGRRGHIYVDLDLPHGNMVAIHQSAPSPLERAPAETRTEPMYSARVSLPGSREIAHLQLSDGEARSGSAPVVVEEPLEIRLGDRPIAVTMRTPGNDIELAMGFLFTENIIEDPGVVVTAAHCDENQNVVEVRTEPGAKGVNPPPQRNFYATSSCGVCGKASIDQIVTRITDVAQDATRVRASVLQTLPAELREAQPLFQATGSLHAAALFRPDGKLLCVREDVGRHNAVDKLVGWAALEDQLPLRGAVLLLSGRCSFEIVQKAAAAGIPIVAAISGTSSLAASFAEEAGQTLIAFLRGREMKVYTAPERIQVD